MKEKKTKNKNLLVSARVTPEEKEYILKQAGESNITESEYILRKIFPEKYRSVIEWENKLKEELSARHKS